MDQISPTAHKNTAYKPRHPLLCKPKLSWNIRARSYTLQNTLN